MDSTVWEITTLVSVNLKHTKLTGLSYHVLSDNVKLEGSILLHQGFTVSCVTLGTQNYLESYLCRNYIISCRICVEDKREE